MVTGSLLQVVLIACSVSCLRGAESDNYLVIAPQAPVIEIGTAFTATCMIINTSKVTADDLYWKLSETTLSEELYTKINKTALSVTVPINSEKPEWLFCLCKKQSPYVILNNSKFIHGILLKKGYSPGKPENLSCEAVQFKTNVSISMKCVWEPTGHQTTTVPTTYRLFVRVILMHTLSVETTGNRAEVVIDVFPYHMGLDIWVEAENELGRSESEHLKGDGHWFVKTNPPSGVTVISEKSFPTSLLINWTHPIMDVYMRLIYQIRFCPNGSQNWAYVPLVDTSKYIQSFRLQNLRPDTVYVTQVRCRNDREGNDHWSDWSANATKRTPEDRPTSKPDIWKVITEGNGVHGRQVQFLCKDPVFANGRIRRFIIKIQELNKNVLNGSWESIPVNRSDVDRSSGQQMITVLKQILLPDKNPIKLHVIAINLVGKSPEASLVIPEKIRGLPPVEELKVQSHGGKLSVEWKFPVSNTTIVSEYVVEWATADHTDWQRENRHTRRTVVKGNLEKFVCYVISVYPIYSGWIGEPASIEAFLEQGAPKKGPDVELRDKPGRNEAELVWKEIPKHFQRGFITNYTIFYTSGTKIHEITVSANTTSYVLRTLLGNTKYDVWITASTVRGSARGQSHSFTTAKYALGEIEGIVVGVSFGFLFIVVLTMLLCIYKRDVIKENFWPQIPNPGESTIGNWSPDYPLKAEMPKENCLSGISVLQVNACDENFVFEEDKGSLPLKKDKYLSEEHSSGIGGSSCMSSPRQSMSDSDEGGDIADTTASTVQYSSVVASNGYKGQIPSLQPQQAIFARSDSTQPLLDSEENTDMLLLEGSRHARLLGKSLGLKHTVQNAGRSTPADFHHTEMETQDMAEDLDFCPAEDNSEQTTPTDNQTADWLPTATSSSYMPQLGGYRPQ
ncbi:uncharacterized protein V6R79_019818 [Siganus canaliculatus]